MSQPHRGRCRIFTAAVSPGFGQRGKVAGAGLSVRVAAAISPITVCSYYCPTSHTLQPAWLDPAP
eukprot:scaffold167932_cov12-Tisochrysis_lutea.AAC.1